MNNKSVIYHRYICRQSEMISPGAKKATQGRCSATQARYISAIQKKLDIRSKKVIHFGRKQGIKWLVKLG